MKNVFVMMAQMMATMRAAYAEHAYRNAGMSVPKGLGRSRTPGPVRPAGSKIKRRAAEHRIGRCN